MATNRECDPAPPSPFPSLPGNTSCGFVPPMATLQHATVCHTCTCSYMLWCQRRIPSDIFVTYATRISPSIPTPNKSSHHCHQAEPGPPSQPHSLSLSLSHHLDTRQAVSIHTAPVFFVLSIYLSCATKHHSAVCSCPVVVYEQIDGTIVMICFYYYTTHTHTARHVFVLSCYSVMQALYMFSNFDIPCERKVKMLSQHNYGASL